ncbi:predicted protein [Nematostella vectensis]|uniref:Uncharacterized protein n=1 Tax=Nematostella vectensis TaxID=45351 RepID=A7SKF1_NEMVE|nr:predicted protein [Nematostella vectensis]|eukprot:XP_001627889.1 predicted protein [Nematostella vectensis]
MKLLLAVLLCAVVYTECHYQTCHEWTKLSESRVCFQGQGGKFGKIVPAARGFLAAVKLVHREGSIVCGSHPGSHTSNWGCHNWPHLEKFSINMLITNKDNHVIFPKTGVNFLPKNPGRWYGMDGFNSRSKELVLTYSFSDPYFVGPESELRLWYAEDLFNQWEADNRGTVCADVYGYFL